MEPPDPSDYVEVAWGPTDEELERALANSNRCTTSAKIYNELESATMWYDKIIERSWAESTQDQIKYTTEESVKYTWVAASPADPPEPDHVKWVESLPYWQQLVSHSLCTGILQPDLGPVEMKVSALLVRIWPGKPDTGTNSRPEHISIHVSRDDQITLDRLIRDHVKTMAKSLAFVPPDVIASAELIISRDRYWKGKQRRLKDLIGTTMADMPPGPFTETAKVNIEKHQREFDSKEERLIQSIKMSKQTEGGPGGANVEIGPFWVDDMSPPSRNSFTSYTAAQTPSQLLRYPTLEAGLKLSEVGAICKAVHDLIEFARNHGPQLGEFRSVDVTDHLTSHAAADEMRLLSNIEKDSTMKRHLTESTLYEELTLDLKDGPKTIADYERMLNQTQVQIKGKASVYIGYLKHMHEWRTSEQPHRVIRRAIFAFQNPTLNNIYRAQSREHRKSSDAINKYWGDHMDALLYYPFSSWDETKVTLESERVLWYKDKLQLPEASEYGFSTSGVYWAHFSEMVNYYKDSSCLHRMYNASDEDVLKYGYHGKPLLSHLLMPFQFDGTSRLTVAAGVQKGEILGLLPGRLRYLGKPGHRATESCSHWIRLVNSVFMEVTPSPFTDIFTTDTTEDNVRQNVEVCYELVDDPHSGVGPSFRVYVVAAVNIEPLQPLST